MEWSTNVNIETPEQIDVSLEIAGLGSRFVAWLVDLMFKVLVVILLGLLGVLLGVMLSATNAPLGERLLSALIVGLISALFLCYNVYFEVRRNGQTPGKKFAGIRVIKVGGAPVDFTAAGIRNMLAMADFLPAFFLLGGFLVMVTRQGQRLGDLAAGTLVVRERLEQAPGDANAFIERLASDEFAFTAEQLAACPSGDRHILRSFFQRHEHLRESPRLRLALKLADEFERKTGYRPTEPLDTQDRVIGFLASLYRDLEKLARAEKG